MGSESGCANDIRRLLLRKGVDFKAFLGFQSRLGDKTAWCLRGLFPKTGLLQF